MKRIVSIFITLIITIFSLNGCFGEKIDIGITLAQTHIDRGEKDGDFLKAEAEKYGYKTVLQWADGDQAVQNNQISGFLKQKVKVIIIGNVNDGVDPVIVEAKRKGAIIIAYDRLIQGTNNYEYFITFNSYKAGELQAESIIKGLNLDAVSPASPKYITLFAGSHKDTNSYFLFQGAIDTLLPYIDSGALVVIGPLPLHYTEPEFGDIAVRDALPENAKRRMDAILKGAASRITLDAILSPNDAISLAIIEACMENSKYREKLPVITGQDAQFSSMMSIKSGEQYSTIFNNTEKLAEAAIMLADQLIKGKSVNIPGVIIADGDLSEIGYTRIGYVKTLLLEPILITRDNITVPAEAGFYTDEQADQLRQ